MEKARKGRKMPDRAYHPLRELVLVRVREFFREPEAIFWVYIFPILLAVGLGVAFRDKPLESVRVVVESEPAGTLTGGALPPAEAASLLGSDPRIRVEVKSSGDAVLDLIRGRSDMIVQSGSGYRYTYDPSRPEAVLARALVNEVLQGRTRMAGIPVADTPSTAPGARYIDFLIPGLIGMNIMGGGLWGVGFVIVELRVRKLLKRFLATPLRKRDFLLSIMGSRMLFLVPEIVLLLLVGCLGFGVPIRGSVWAVAAVCLAGALCFSGMGLLVASRARKMETVSGILNFVMLPMWVSSGIFFSAERFPDAVQPFIHALPLTAAIDGLRAVMLEGRPLSSQWAEFLVMAFWGILSYIVSLRIFRWS